MVVISHMNKMTRFICNCQYHFKLIKYRYKKEKLIGTPATGIQVCKYSV